MGLHISAYSDSEIFDELNNLSDEDFDLIERQIRLKYYDDIFRTERDDVSGLVLYNNIDLMEWLNDNKDNLWRYDEHRIKQFLIDYPNGCIEIV